MNAGDIYWAELAGGRHPVVVVSCDIFNRGEYVVVVPITSTRVAERSELPNCVAFRAGEFGLPKACVAQAEQIACIESRVLDGELLGRLNLSCHRRLVHAIGYTLSAVCELA